MYHALDVAKYVIFYCKEKEYFISNLKLQKIMYFIQAEFLVADNTHCFINKIEAWDFGPVVPDVYHEYKVFGSSSIIEDVCSKIVDRFTKADIQRMNNIINWCARYSTSTLVEITHSQSPWRNAYQRYCQNKITNQSLRGFFREE